MIRAMLTLVILASAPADDRRDPASVGDGDCGARALFLLARALGAAPTLEEILGGLPPRGPSGYSLKDLRDMSVRLKVPLVGVDLGKLDRGLDGPALVHLRRGGHGHYVVVRPVARDGRIVQVIDPGGAIRLREVTELTGSPEWTGHALGRQADFFGTPLARLAPLLATVAGLIAAVALGLGPQLGRLAARVARRSA